MQCYNACRLKEPTLSGAMWFTPKVEWRCFHDEEFNCDIAPTFSAQKLHGIALAPNLLCAESLCNGRSSGEGGKPQNYTLVKMEAQQLPGKLAELQVYPDPASR